MLLAMTDGRPWGTAPPMTPSETTHSVIVPCSPPNYGTGVSQQDAPDNVVTYVLYPTRWRTLALYSALAFVNASVWLMYAPIAPEVSRHFGMSTNAVDMFSLVYMMVRCGMGWVVVA